jgi:protein TonB
LSNPASGYKPNPIASSAGSIIDRMTAPSHSGHRVRRRAPQLAVPWESRRAVFWSNMAALLRGPAPPKGWPVSKFFHDSWVRGDFPRKALFVSVLWHAVVFNFPVFLFPSDSRRPQELTLPRIELLYFPPTRDLPPIAPRADAVKPAQPSPRGEPIKPPPLRGADAYRPRQTIVSMPARITHPRQTLIQPDAPPEPPKILPALPNIAQWDARPMPARPKLRLDAAKLRARLSATRRAADTEAPQIQNNERNAGTINLAASPVAPPKPRLAISPSARARIGPRDAGNDVFPAPEIGQTAGNGAGLRRVIALSANPAPAAPIVDIPVGNLRAPITLSPEGLYRGVPGGAVNGEAGSTGGAGGSAGSPGGTGGAGGTQPGTGGGTAGPEGIIITAGDPKNTANISGPGGAGNGAGKPASPLLRSALPDRPIPRAAPRPELLNPARGAPEAAIEKYVPGTPPENILGPRRVYTLNVNMPNLNSATGSWILQFAEMRSPDARRPDLPMLAPPGDLVGPAPERKVDPQYPPALRSARVEGEVVLYAIIRKDGSVDSVQLLKGVEPRLDQNAMDALARWKFRPAERNGAPIELEAVVRIPFRVTSPF